MDFSSSFTETKTLRTVSSTFVCYHGCYSALWKRWSPFLHRPAMKNRRHFSCFLSTYTILSRIAFFLYSHALQNIIRQFTSVFHSPHRKPNLCFLHSHRTIRWSGWVRYPMLSLYANYGQCIASCRLWFLLPIRMNMQKILRRRWVLWWVFGQRSHRLFYSWFPIRKT